MATLDLTSLPHTPPMPVLFVGHGSPMHALEQSVFSQSWARVGEGLPPPSAILVVSAHWMTRGMTLVHIGRKPRTIHDFYGFPPALYAQHYDAPGAPGAAELTLDLLRDHHAMPDAEWGLDHGAWCVLLHMFPKADVPVFQISLDLSRSMRDHMALAADLRALRRRGVLIVASGNVVHNLRAMMPGVAAFDWARDFDTMVADTIANGDFGKLAEMQASDALFRRAHPTIDHFLPLLYTLGAAEAGDDASTFAEGFDLGSISMRSVMLARP